MAKAKQNTAMMQLKKWVDDNYPNFNQSDIEKKIGELLKTEKLHLKIAYNEGISEAGFDEQSQCPATSFEEYFNNTYKK